MEKGVEYSAIFPNRPCRRTFGISDRMWFEAIAALLNSLVIRLAVRGMYTPRTAGASWAVALKVELVTLSTLMDGAPVARHGIWPYRLCEQSQL